MEVVFKHQRKKKISKSFQLEIAFLTVIIKNWDGVTVGY